MSGEDKVTGKCPYDDEDTELKLEYTLYQPAGYPAPVHVYTTNRCPKSFDYGCDPNNCPIALSYGFQ